MESWERNKVDSEFSKIGVKLTWESDRASNTRHGNRDEMVKITVGWGGKFKSSEADIVEGFVINNLDFISVFNELMNGESSVIWFNDSIGDLWRWEYRESFHNSIWIFFSDLRDKESTHTGTGTTTKRVGDLETLEAIATFSFFSNDIEDGVDEFSTFGIMTLGPVVTSTSLSEYEVVWSEKLSEWSGSYGVHGTRFEIHQDSSWDKSTSSSFVEIDIDSFELKVGVSVIGTGRVDSVFIRDDFPEFSTDLITALTCLDVDEFSHCFFCF